MTITAIAVLVTSLTLISMADVAQADTGTKELKCKEIISSFFPPGPTTIFSSGVGDCSELGEVSSAGVFGVPVAMGSAANCVALTTPVDSFLISEKGFITLAATGPIAGPAWDQCFFTDAALSTPASPAGAFCAGGLTDPAFSTVTGDFTVTGGLVDGKVVTGGSGTVSSVVNHCDFGAAPFANSAVTSLMGTIDLSDDDDVDDECREEEDGSDESHESHDFDGSDGSDGSDNTDSSTCPHDSDGSNSSDGSQD